MRTSRALALSILGSVLSRFQLQHHYSITGAGVGFSLCTNWVELSRLSAGARLASSITASKFVPDSSYGLTWQVGFTTSILCSGCSRSDYLRSPLVTRRLPNPDAHLVWAVSRFPESQHNLGQVTQCNLSLFRTHDLQSYSYQTLILSFDYIWYDLLNFIW